jgi:hypothetical protein
MIPWILAPTPKRRLKGVPTRVCSEFAFFFFLGVRANRDLRQPKNLVARASSARSSGSLDFDAAQQQLFRVSY